MASYDDRTTSSKAHGNDNERGRKGRDMSKADFFLSTDDNVRLFRSISLGGHRDGPHESRPRYQSLESKPVAIKAPPGYHSNGSNHHNKTITPNNENPSGWAVSKLHRLGYFHPLEPCHSTIRKSDLPNVLARLTDSFRNLSCQVWYDADSLSAHCQTMDCVSFFVSLFENNDNDQTVLVEVQHSACDSYLFHHNYARPILDLLNGQYETLDNKLSIVRPQRRFGNTGPSCFEKLDSLAHHCRPEDVAEAVQLAAQLVTSDRVDARELGIQSLAMLADVHSAGWYTARSVAHLLVMPPLDPLWQKLVKTLLRYLWGNDNFKDNEYENEVAYHALQVWSNAWQVASRDADTHLHDALSRDREVTRMLMEALSRRVSDHAQHPHHATWALRAVTALCTENPDLQPFVSRSMVEQACRAPHAALSEAALKFLQTAVH